MTAAANTKDCFREALGKRVVGLLFDALPSNRRDLAAGTKTLVFDDGTGLTISAEGTYWTESLRDIEIALRERRKELEALKRDLSETLAADGLLAAVERA